MGQNKGFVACLLPGYFSNDSLVLNMKSVIKNPSIFRVDLLRFPDLRSRFSDLGDSCAPKQGMAFSLILDALPKRAQSHVRQVVIQQR